MFYLQLLMNKRGPLAKIWLAAHWDKKVTKVHIFECNLETTIEKILSAKFKIAVRTLGHLLLGVVRIYHRKTKYLLTDCSEALLKMQSTFQPGLVDLPKGNSEASYDAITLPEEFYDFDTPLPETNTIDVVEHFTLNQSKAENITLIEDCGQNVLLHGDSFVADIETPRCYSFFNDSLLSSCSLLAEHSSSNSVGNKTALDENINALICDGFGDEGVPRDMIDDVLGTDQYSLLTILDMAEEMPLLQKNAVDEPVGQAITIFETKNNQLNEPTFFSNKEDGFVLDPILDSALPKKQRNTRKRKLLVDAVKQLSKATMQKQLTSCEDTVTTLHIAPPTKKLMILQELGGVEKLMSRPTQPLFSKDLQRLYAKCLKNGRKKWQEDFEEKSKLADQELPITESLNILQDTVYPITPSVLQSSSNERDNNIHFKTMEVVDIASSLPYDCLTSPVQQESENEQVALENGAQTNNLDSEEQRRNKITLKLLNNFRHFNKKGAKSFSFLALCREKNNKEVAAKFYSLLVLRKQDAVVVAQAVPYADITVTVGPKFYTL